MAVILAASLGCEGALDGPSFGDAALDVSPHDTGGPLDGPGPETPPGKLDGPQHDSGDAAKQPPDTGAPRDKALPDKALSDKTLPDKAPPDKAQPACPAGHKRVGGVCVPSCVTAGGDTCTSSATTLCLGLPQLTSHDCAICCKRPAYPSAGVFGFHVVTKWNTYAWDSILALAKSNPKVIIASQNPQAGVAYTSWARNIHPTQFATPTAMADAMHKAFVTNVNSPRVILIDELKSTTQPYIKAVADRMRTVYPQWKGRWGAYLVNGTAVSYPSLAAGIDALLMAGAIIVPEMYPHKSSYCKSGTSAGARDKWLGEFFRGSGGAFPQGRFHWLVQRRTYRKSASALPIVFGVTDSFVGGSGASVFIDRMFYVWVTRSGYPGTISLANGGPGAWKWDHPAMSNTSRDLAFAQSYQHYVVQGKKTSRLGQVKCP